MRGKFKKILSYCTLLFIGGVYGIHSVAASDPCPKTKIDPSALPQGAQVSVVMPVGTDNETTATVAAMTAAFTSMSNPNGPDANPSGNTFAVTTDDSDIPPANPEIQVVVDTSPGPAPQKDGEDYLASYKPTQWAQDGTVSTAVITIYTNKTVSAPTPTNSKATWSPLSYKSDKSAYGLAIQAITKHETVHAFGIDHDPTSTSPDGPPGSSVLNRVTATNNSDHNVAQNITNCDRSKIVAGQKCPCRGVNMPGAQ